MTSAKVIVISNIMFCIDTKHALTRQRMMPSMKRSCICQR